MKYPFKYWSLTGPFKAIPLHNATKGDKVIDFFWQLTGWVWLSRWLWGRRRERVKDNNEWKTKTNS